MRKIRITQAYNFMKGMKIWLFLILIVIKKSVSDH